jgi:glycosyltransferase involved in cell wall biosynthesis
MNQPVALGQAKKIEVRSGRPVRVLHLINGEHYSGAERVQDLLGIRMAAFGYETGFACLKPLLFPEKRMSRNKLFRVEMQSKIDFGAIRRLHSIVQDHDFRILHAHTPRTLLAGSLLKRRSGCSLVYHVHSPVGRDSTRSLTNRINQLVESWSARQVDHFICVSDNIRDYMIEIGHPPEKLSTVANGVPLLADVPDRPDPQLPWTLGTTALFRPRKGMEVLLESMALLVREGRDVRLLAVGPFETEAYKAKIRSLAADLGIDDRIEWTGFVSDVHSCFQRMDAFVLPSLFGEGLPMVILEAMAAGTPVISADVEGVRQAIREDRDGLIFPPGDASRLSHCVNRLLGGECDWQSLRQSALARQRDHFSDASMAAGVAMIYDRLAACGDDNG